MRLQWFVGDRSTLEQLKKWHRIKPIICPSCSINLVGEERAKNISIRQSGIIVELQHIQCKVAKAKKIFVCKKCGFTSTLCGKWLFRQCGCQKEWNQHTLPRYASTHIKKYISLHNESIFVTTWRVMGGIWDPSSFVIQQCNWSTKPQSDKRGGDRRRCGQACICWTQKWAHRGHLSMLLIDMPSRCYRDSGHHDHGNGEKDQHVARDDDGDGDDTGHSKSNNNNNTSTDNDQ